MTWLIKTPPTRPGDYQHNPQGILARFHLKTLSPLHDSRTADTSVCKFPYSIPIVYYDVILLMNGIQ